MSGAVQAVSFVGDDIQIQAAYRNGRSAQELRVITLLGAGLNDDELEIIAELQRAAQRVLEMADERVEHADFVRAPERAEPSHGPYDAPQDIARRQDQE